MAFDGVVEWNADVADGAHVLSAGMVQSEHTN